ncbi:MAG: gliding motility-associated C-terminal domain-containing protein [Chitinophagaceae bacterium]
MKITIPILCLLTSYLCAAQPGSVVPSFTIPDTVCVNTPVTISNTSINASTYFWNFCVAGINSTPVSVNLGNPGNTLSQPVFSDIVEDNGSFYAFVVDFLNAGITRLDFGNSMLNTPLATNLGNPSGALNNRYGKEGIQVIKNEGKWYAIIVGGNLPGNGSIPRIVKIEFGTNIANNAPTGTNWGNLGLLDEPLDLHMFQENGIWYGFTINAESNTITRFNFTNSFNNIPTAVNLGNIGGLHYPTGIYAANDNGFWRVFITNGQAPYSITRLDFGSSLLNIPTGNNLGNPGNVLNSPRDFTILKLCDEIAGFAVNGVSNDLVKFDFHNNLQSIPTGSSLGNTGNLNFPHSLSKFFRVGNDLYTLITNVNNNTITRLQFKGCSTASISSSALQNPLPVTYNAPGTFNINLSVDEGLPTQNSFCKQVVVLPALIHTPLQKVVACNTDSIKIGGANKQASFVWNTGATTDSIYVKAGGKYWLVSSRFGCTNTDSFTVSIDQIAIQSNNDTTVCAGQPVQMNTTSNAVSYTWTPATGLSGSGIANPVATALVNTQYIVTGKSANGCLANDTVSISINPSPVISKTNDTAVCQRTTVQLNVTGGNGYTWLPAAGLSNTNIPNPLATPVATTTYYFTVSNTIGCSRSDSIKVLVKPNPVISKTNDSTICKNKTIQLSVSGGASYTWLPNQGLSNTSIANPIATPGSNATYYVTVTSSGNCSSTDSIKVFVNPSPVITKTNDTAICQQKTVQLNVSGGSSYTWLPAAGLSNTGIANPLVTPLVTTNYYFTAANIFNCSTSDSIKVLVKPNPVIVKTNDTAICNGKTIQLHVSGGNSYTWLSNTGLSDASIPDPVATPTRNTTYYVTVTNTDNCISSDSIKIYLKANPVITKNNDTAVCQLKTVQLNVSGGSSYAWQANAGLSNNSIPNPVATPLVNTIFYVTVTNAGNCSNTDSIRVLVKANPVISKNSDTSVCHDRPVQLNVSGGSSYTWLPAATLNNTSIANPVASPVANTTYYVTVTNTGNCSTADSIKINVKPLPVFGISGGISVCKGSQLRLTAFGGDTYSWAPATDLDNTNTATPVATPALSTVYTVKIKANACMDSASLATPVTVLLLPVVRAGSSNDVDCAKPVTQLTASGASQYLWQPTTALNDSAIAAPLSSPSATTMYFVKGTDLNGCSNYDSIAVKVTHAGDLLVNLPNAFTPNGDHKNDCFGVSRYAGLLKNVELSVYDRWGVRVFYTTSPLNCWDGRYKGKLQDAGGFVYILRANTFCGEILKKGMLMLIK